MNSPLLQAFLRKNVTNTFIGIAECSEHLAVLMFGMGVAAVDAMFNAEDIGCAEAARLREQLRAALDQHHPEGYAKYLELIKDWPPESGVHCTGHVDYDPASRGVQKNSSANNDADPQP